jgi:cytosine/uracil/thiamine/allantoin permease
VNAVAAGQDRYISLQACIVPLLLLNWGMFSHQAPSFQFLTKPLALLALPLAELAIVLSVVGLLLGTAIHVLVGERVKHWSSVANMVQRMAEHVLVGTFSRAYFGHGFADGHICPFEPWF